MKIKVLPILLLLPFFAFSQTAEEKRKIASFSNHEANAVLAKELQKEEQERKLRLDAYLKSNPHVSKIEITDDGFGKKELMDVLPNGEKIYAQTHNAGAATTARATALYNGGSLGINIQGQGMTAGVWDGGGIRTSHQEFMVNGASKVTSMDGASLSSHATHVGGTIAAQGIVSNVRGLAFNSSLKSYDWYNDLSEMLSEAPNLLVSNHSYGMGDLNSAWFYGAYDSRARQIDMIAYNNPYYLPIISAGNDRNAGINDEPAAGQNSSKFGFDLIFGHGNAKNVLTVAAVNQVTNYNGPSSVTMSSFSSWGPSDDGRIKPEISMKGVNVISTTSTNNTSVGSSSGTSMASPGITGIGLLLQQYYSQLYSTYMRSATLKGLILHTADEAGTDPGPDYQFGWGLVNANKAAQVIRDKNLTQNSSIIEEHSLTNGSTYTKTISASGSAPLKVSISWTDPAYPSQNNGVNDPSIIYLVNDLDVVVTKMGGDVYFPWKLQGLSAPWLNATNTGSNDVDNFERIDISNPNGQYTITVTHKGNLTNNTQDFSLIVTSDNLSTLSTNDVNNKTEAIEIFPNPVENVLYLSNSKKSDLQVLDSTGKLIMRESVSNGQLNVAHLPIGIYYLIYKGEDNVSKSFKFIKK